MEYWSSFASTIVESVKETVVNTIEKTKKIGIFMKKKLLLKDYQCVPWNVQEESKTIIEEELKQKILKLSQEELSFTLEAPDESIFAFDMNFATPFAAAAVSADANLNNIRFLLVPKKISDREFWRNYFYRVSMIREQFGVEQLLLAPLNSTNINNEKVTLEKSTKEEKPSTDVESQTHSDRAVDDKILVEEKSIQIEHLKSDPVIQTTDFQNEDFELDDDFDFVSDDYRKT